MKSPIVSRETYEAAIAERQDYASRLERLTLLYADAQAKITALELELADHEPEARDENVSQAGITMGRSRISRVVGMANEYARNKAQSAEKAR